MQEVDAGTIAHLPDHPSPAISGSVEAPHWPNATAVLEVLAALEEEFKAVLSRPAGV